MGEEKSILRLGGLSGLLAGILTILAFVILGLQLVLGRPPAMTAEQQCMNVSQIREAWVLANGILVIAFLFLVPLFLALHRLTGEMRPTSTLVGEIFGIAGAFVFGVNWAMIMTGFPFLSDLYAIASAAERPMLVVGCQVLEWTTHAFQLFGGLLIGVAFASLGWGMLARPNISRAYGWTSVVLGILVAVGWITSVLSGESANAFVAAVSGVGFIAMLALFILLGWKVYRMSRTA